MEEQFLKQFQNFTEKVASEDFTEAILLHYFKVQQVVLEIHSQTLFS